MKKKDFLFPLLGIIIFLIIWQITAAWYVNKEWLLPTPFVVTVTFGNEFSLLMHHSFYTLTEALIGMLLAIFLSGGFALLLSFSLSIKKIIYPLLLGSQMIPIIVLAPLFIIWFGYDILPKVLVVILICFFPATINIMAGLNATDAETLAFYRSMGMNKKQLFLLVQLPQALPYFFSGLRISAVYSVMGAVIGEWLGAEAGLGLLLVRAQQSFDLPLVFATILTIIIWSSLIFVLVILVERKTLSWQKYLKEEQWQV